MTGLALVVVFEPTYSTAILPSFSITCDITELHENVLAGLAGFEPANNGVKVQCLTTWRQPKMLNRATGLSPVGARVEFDRA